MAHTGIYQSVHKELDAIKEAIQNCEVNERTYFVLTGHSLGGGLATMLYTHLKTSSEYQNNRMIVMTFGAPLVLAPNESGTKFRLFFAAKICLGDFERFSWPFSFTDRIFLGWPEALRSISKDVHNFVHNADIIPRVLGNENVKLLPMFANVSDTGRSLTRVNLPLEMDPQTHFLHSC